MCLAYSRDSKEQLKYIEGGGTQQEKKRENGVQDPVESYRLLYSKWNEEVGSVLEEE